MCRVICIAMRFKVVLLLGGYNFWIGIIFLYWQKQQYTSNQCCCTKERCRLENDGWIIQTQIVCYENLSTISTFCYLAGDFWGQASDFFDKKMRKYHRETDQFLPLQVRSPTSVICAVKPSPSEPDWITTELLTLGWSLTSAASVTTPQPRRPRWWATWRLDTR